MEDKEPTQSRRSLSEAEPGHESVLSSLEPTSESFCSHLGSSFYSLWPLSAWSLHGILSILHGFNLKVLISSLPVFTFYIF